MSTRRTYVALSAAIAASAMQRPTAAQEVQRRFTASLIADALAKENRAFDTTRFLHDCGVIPSDKVPTGNVVSRLVTRGGDR